MCLGFQAVRLHLIKVASALEIHMLANPNSSFVLKKASEQLKAGKSPSYTIISNIDDPDAVGAERVAFYDCKIEKLTLADWERGKGGEETYGFTFEDWDLLDTTR